MPIAPQALKQLQERIDNKLIDPRKLSSEQADALDSAFQSGELKGYKGVSEMIAERDIGRTLVKKEIEEKLAPLTPRQKLGLGIKRGTLVALGDITGSFTPYIMDGKKLAAQARIDAIAGKTTGFMPYKVGTEKAINTFSNLLTKLPGVKGLKLFQGTAKALDKFGSAIKGSYVLPQLGKTELKSQALGAAGAASGSIAYDAINFPAQFVAGATDDLKKIDQNVYNQMSPTEKITYHALSNAREALLWNAGAFGLFATLGGTARGAAKLFKLNPEATRLQNEAMANQGLPVPGVLTAEGQTALSTLFKDFNRFLPTPSAQAVAKQAKQLRVGMPIAQIYANLQNALNVPLLHQELVARAVGGTIEKTYLESGRLYGSLYKGAEDTYNSVGNLVQEYSNKLVDAYKLRNKGLPVVEGDDTQILRQLFPNGTDIPMFPTENLRKNAQAIVKRKLGSYTPETLQRMRMNGVESTAFDPITGMNVEILARLDEYAAKRKSDLITPNEFLSLRRDWNANYVRTRRQGTDELQADAFNTLAAFEKDFNFATKRGANDVSVLERSPQLDATYKVIAEYLGPKEANEFLAKFQGRFKVANQNQIDANFMFARSVNFYNNANMPKLYRNVDAYALTPNQVLNVGGRERLSDIESTDLLFRAAFNPRRGNTDSVEELYKLLGGQKGFSQEVQDNARFTMGLLLKRKFFDAFNQSAITRFSPGGAVKQEAIKPFETVGKSLDEAIDEVKKVYGKDLDKGIEDLMKIDMPSGPVSQGYVNDLEYTRKAFTPDLLKKVIDEGKIDLSDKVYLTKEKMQYGIKAKPLTEDIAKITEKATQIYERDAAGNIIREIPKAERRIAQKELEEIGIRLRGFQGFNYNKFARELGITTNEGRAQLAKGFEISQGLGKEAAEKHVNNIDTAIQYLERDATTAMGDLSTFATRSMTIGIAVGGFGGGFLAGGFTGGIVGAVAVSLGIRGLSQLANNPKLLQKWIDLYSDGQRLDVNELRSMAPPRRAILADVFNYITADDPDAPIIDPNDIKDQQIIEYLQKNPVITRGPTKRGLFDTMNEEIKERFNPDLKRLKQLSQKELEDIQDYTNGVKVADVKAALMDQSTKLPAGQQLPQTTQQFIEEQPEIDIPEGTKQGAAQITANIPQSTQMVYDALFPNDNLMSAIAAQKNATS